MTSCRAVIGHLGLLGAAGAGLGQGQEAGQRGQGDQGHQQQVIHLGEVMVGVNNEETYTNYSLIHWC